MNFPEIDKWQQLKHWMGIRGFVFRETAGKYQRMNAPIYSEVIDGVSIRVTFVWDREPGFKWLDQGEYAINWRKLDGFDTIFEHWEGVHTYPRRYVWEYYTKPIHDGYQIKLSAYMMPNLENGHVKFMGYDDV